MQRARTELIFAAGICGSDLHLYDSFQLVLCSIAYSSASGDLIIIACVSCMRPSAAYTRLSYIYAQDLGSGC